MHDQGPALFILGHKAPIMADGREEGMGRMAGEEAKDEEEKMMCV